MLALLPARARRALTCLVVLAPLALAAPAPGCGGGAAPDPCADVTCANGGVCAELDDAALCVCAPGFAGPTCAEDVDDCAATPCANGGTCADLVDGFACSCAPGFAGPTCAENLDDCAANPCANGGTCFDLVDEFACDCLPGFAGSTCAEDLDDCAGNPCFNGGVCADEVDAFHCACPVGAWGAQCEALIAPLAITAAPVPLAIALEAFTHQLAWTGGDAEARWVLLDNPDMPWLGFDEDGLLAGTPSPGDEGTFAITLRVEQPLYPANAAEVTLEVTVLAERPEAYATSFEGACPDGWTLTGDWQCGVPTNVGPSTFDGAQCLGTQLAGNYNNNQTWLGTTATSPPIALPADVPMRLTFRMWVHTEGSTYDGANLAISTDDGASYALLTDVAPVYPLVIGGEPAWGGALAGLGWQLVEADLSAFAGATARLRLAFRSDTSGTFPGVYVDDVRVAY